MFRCSFDTALSSTAVAMATVGAVTAAIDGLPAPKGGDSVLPDINNPVVPWKISTVMKHDDINKSLLLENRNRETNNKHDDTKKSLLLENTSHQSTIKNSVDDQMNGIPIDHSVDLGILESKNNLSNGEIVPVLSDNNTSTNDAGRESTTSIAHSSHYDSQDGSWDPAGGGGLDAVNAQFARELLVNCAGGMAQPTDCSYRNLLLDCESCLDRPLLPPDAHMANLVRSCYYGKSDCPYNAEIGCWDISQVVDMTAAFYKLTDFNEPLNCWDTSSVTRMRSMFNAASSFDQPIGMWNTTYVTDMNGMFFEALQFNQTIGDWDTSSVSNMRRMFSLATSFNQPIGNWETEYLEDMSIMFFGASGFNQPIDQWDVSRVIFYSGMFQEASSFNQCLSAWSSKMRNGVLNWAMFTDSGCPYRGEETGLDIGPWCQGVDQQCYDLDAKLNMVLRETDASDGATDPSPYSLSIITLLLLFPLL